MKTQKVMAQLTGYQTQRVQEALDNNQREYAAYLLAYYRRINDDAKTIVTNLNPANV